MIGGFAGVGDFIKGEVVKVENVEGGQNVTLALDNEEREGDEVTLFLPRPKRPLYAADPNCDHDIEIRASGYGCKKCPGWFCL